MAQAWWWKSTPTKRKSGRSRISCSPYDAQRLPNGNTLITDNQSVQEVNTKQEVKWKVDANGGQLRGHRF